jgi:putative CocE/NonD family hydrolase
MARQANVPVEMADGTVLRADVFVPTDRQTGQPATGSFPVILTQTPYGKSAGSTAGAIGGGVNPYLVERGYIHVVADVRGTGASEGVWTLFEPIQAKDGAALVNWAAALPNSNGRVGLLGLSYLGIIQYLTAAEVGPDSPLRAILPIAAGNDLYREATFGGGIPNAGFSLGYSAITAGAQFLNPLAEFQTDAAAIAALGPDRVASIKANQVDLATNISTGGDKAYDEDWWMARNPVNTLERIVDNGVAALAVGGWHDLFQRGALQNYAGFQNASAGRPVPAPMAADQPVDPRYQALVGPWYHLNFGTGLDFNRIELAWFDTWLKDAPTGLAESTTPAHIYDIGAKRWVDTARYPFEGAPAQTMYLGDGTLSPTAPAGGEAADPILFTGLSNPCGRSPEQYSAGGNESWGSQWGGGNRCASGGAGPFATPLPAGSLTYTTEAFDEAQVLAGPIGVTLFATSNRPDTQWVATVEDVAPDGSTVELSTGALLGSFRAVDDAATWPAPDGRPILPHHPYTRASAQPVVPGELTRYDVEVFPIMAEIPAGHRLRLVLNTSATGYLVPTASQFANLVGGAYEVHRHGAAASSVQLPLAPVSAFADECELCR